MATETTCSDPNARPREPARPLSSHQLELEAGVRFDEVLSAETTQEWAHAWRALYRVFERMRQQRPPHSYGRRVMP
jgi:hypothetical protein